MFVIINHLSLRKDDIIRFKKCPSESNSGDHFEVIMFYYDRSVRTPSHPSQYPLQRTLAEESVFQGSEDECREKLSEFTSILNSTPPPGRRT